MTDGRFLNIRCQDLIFNLKMARMRELPNDELKEIFSSLRRWPLESCRLVCQRWKGIIDQHFMKISCIVSGESEDVVIELEECIKTFHPSHLLLHVTSVPDEVWSMIPSNLDALTIYAQNCISPKLLPCSQIRSLTWDLPSDPPLHLTTHLVHLSLTLADSCDISHLDQLSSLKELDLEWGRSMDFDLPTSLKRLACSCREFDFNLKSLFQLEELHLKGAGFRKPDIEFPSSLKVIPLSISFNFQLEFNLK